MKPVVPKNSISLPDTKRGELLDRMDGKAGSSQSSQRRHERRTDTRFEYRKRDVIVRVEHLGGGTSDLLVSSRNLSSGGIGFLHGAFMHMGSKCLVVLVAKNSDVVQLRGAVVMCRHVEGLVHEIGVQFDRRIQPERFISGLDEDHEAQHSMEVPKLRGRLLYVEDTKAEAALLEHFVKSTGLMFVNVKSPGAALDAVKKSPFDYVFTDLDVDGEDGVELITKLRSARFAGQIVVVTADNSTKRLKAATAAGADEHLLMPYAPDELYVLLKRLQDRVSGLEGGLLYSARANDPSMAELVKEFMSDAGKAAEKIQKALDEQQLDAIRSVCIQLKGSAPAYGYEPLGALAAKTIELLDDNQSIEATTGQLRRLVIMCQSLALSPEKKKG